MIPRSSLVSNANSLWLCLHVHVTMHIYAMWSVSDNVCHPCNWPRFCYAGQLRHTWIHEHVNMHIYDEQTVCDYACMCMWLCPSMLCSQFVTMYARAWAMQLYAVQSSCDYACLCMCLCTPMPCSQFVILQAWACGYARMCMWLCTSTARSHTLILPAVC